MQAIKWSDISRYREELFGLSIISIIMLHYFDGVIASTNANGILKTIAFIYNGLIGSTGVDIFLFLSGFGIYHSLQKCHPLQQRIIGFYVRRIKRVIVPYLIIGGAFWINKDFIIEGSSVSKFIYDYSLLSFWGEGTKTFWYITLICILYLVSPVLSKNNRRIVWGIILSTIGSVLMYYGCPEKFAEIEIAILRIPIYVVGMYCGALSSAHKSVTLPILVLLALSVPLRLMAGLTSSAFLRMYGGLYAIFMIIAYVMFRLNHPREVKIYSLLTLAGAFSLELYITHVALRNLMWTLGTDKANLPMYGVCILLSVILSIGVAKLSAKLSAKLTTK